MDFRNLSIEERFQLMEDIWDSISEDQGSLKLTPEQSQELRRRLAAYRLTGERGSPAEEVLERVRASL